jgi:beta-glucosidase
LYVDADLEALFPFGYGLGYTTFEYSNLKAAPDQLKDGDTLEVSFDLENTGARAGTEVPQLYTRSWNTSVVRPVLELRAFDRVTLKPGEKRWVTFRVPSEQLKYYGVDYKSGRLTGRILEPHELQIKVGPNSRRIALQNVVNVK